jgi:hypothetical protein
MRALERSRLPVVLLGHPTNGSGEPQRRQQRSPGISLLPSPDAKDRLDSWKEIASHLRRTVRTVQRWERHEGLPVHRHLHRRANSVYAYRAEIDDWWDREARSIEVRPIQAPSEGTSSKVTSSQQVKSLYSDRPCRQTGPTRPEWFIECVLEVRAPGSVLSAMESAFCFWIATTSSCSRGSAPIGNSQGTTRNAKATCRSLSLAASQRLLYLPDLRNEPNE